jgi:hypothetical protein
MMVIQLLSVILFFVFSKKPLLSFSNNLVYYLTLGPLVLCDQVNIQLIEYLLEFRTNVFQAQSIFILGEWIWFKDALKERLEMRKKPNKTRGNQESSMKIVQISLDLE